MIRITEQTKQKRFRIICLKRSKFRESADFEYTSDWYLESDIVYWKENRAGYTNDIAKAGEYTLYEINECCGSWLDWMLEPVWR